MTENIRGAILEDIVDIVAMVHHLAGFERVADQCMLTETQMYTGFSARLRRFEDTSSTATVRLPRIRLWFLSFSTWDGVAGDFLEDLYVRLSFRRRGLCRRLLATLAGECLDNGYTRLP